MRAAKGEPETPSAEDVLRVVSTLQTWVSWIHEDVGEQSLEVAYLRAV